MGILIKAFKKAMVKRGDTIATLAKKINITSPQNLYTGFKEKQNISMPIIEAILKEYNLKIVEKDE